MSSLPAWASPYVRIPYRADGRDHQGVDCYGLVRLVLLERFGVELPRYDVALAGTDPRKLSATERLELEHLWGDERDTGPWRPLDPSELGQAGDVVDFRVSARRGPHCGILATPFALIHIPAGGKVLVTDPRRPGMRKVLESRHRHAALEPAALAAS